MHSIKHIILVFRWKDYMPGVARKQAVFDFAASKAWKNNLTFQGFFLVGIKVQGFPKNDMVVFSFLKWKSTASREVKSVKFKTWRYPFNKSSTRTFSRMTNLLKKSKNLYMAWKKIRLLLSVLLKLHISMLSLQVNFHSEWKCRVTAAHSKSLPNIYLPKRMKWVWFETNELQHAKTLTRSFRDTAEKCII